MKYLYSDFFKPKKVFADFFKANGELVTYAKGHHILHQSDEGKHMHLLVDGIVRMSHIFPDDTEQIIAYFVPGMIFGQAGSFWGFDEGRMTSAAETKVTILRVARGTFMSTFEKSSEFTAAFMEILLHNQIALVNRTMVHGVKGVEAQCMQLIWFMVKFFGRREKNICRIVVPLTQTTMANMLGVTRASINPVLQKLTKKKLISMEKKFLTVLDVEKLKKMTFRM